MIIGILIATICLPINLAHAQVQDISTTKLIDELSYKKTLFVITTDEKTYHIIVTANISIVGTERVVDLNATLYNPHNASITATAQIPDTLNDAPYYNGAVVAFRIHLSAWAVDALKIALPIVIVVVLILQVVFIIEDYIERPLLETLKTMIFGGDFIYASLPWVLLTLLQDSNADGWDLYVPYLPISPHLNLLLKAHYFVATNFSWWEIRKQEAYTDIPIPFDGVWHIVWFTYFQAIWNRSRAQPRPLLPTAEFVWKPNQPVVNETVTFMSTSYSPNETITSHHWWLGDGTEAAVANFTHAYATDGSYNVTLVVNDSLGQTASVVHTIMVQPIPQAVLRVLPGNLMMSVQSGQSSNATFYVGEGLNMTNLQNVQFQLSDLRNPDNYSISQENVNFDKNGIDIPKGTYTNITLTVKAPSDAPYSWYDGNTTVTSENGGNATIFLGVRVFGPPTADFTWAPSLPWAGGLVTFNASSSSAPGSGIVEYTWDFGDHNNTSLTDPVVDHVYAGLGTYNVTLTVTNSDGLNDTISKIIEIRQHDVAVVEVTPSRSWVYQGNTVDINVTLANEGNFTESVAVWLYYNITSDKQIGTETISLDPGENRTLMFTWNTRGVQYCHNYTITAKAEIQFDSNSTNNILDSFVKVKVRILGDINGDGRVDMQDIGLAAAAFGAYPGHIRWNQDTDVNEDNRINMKDIALISKNFGKCA